MRFEFQPSILHESAGVFTTQFRRLDGDPGLRRFPRRGGLIRCRSLNPTPTKLELAQHATGAGKVNRLSSVTLFPP